MNNVLLRTKLISLLNSKRNLAVENNEYSSFQLDNDLNYLMMFECKSAAENRVIVRMFELIFGYSYREIKLQIIAEQMALRKEFEELDEFVESLKLKPLTPKECFAVEDNVVSNYISENSKEVSWSKHTDEDELFARMESNSQSVNRVMKEYNQFKTQDRIAEIIPKMDDNYVLNKSLVKLKKLEQELKKLPKEQRGELKEVQFKINTIKSWL